MSVDRIREHFVQYLGQDVGVYFADNDDPSHVTLYRPDRLPDPFVTWAFEALEKSSPSVAWAINRLLVSYESRHGRTQRAVDITSNGRKNSVIN
jgi:hypothetical protein